VKVLQKNLKASDLLRLKVGQIEDLKAGDTVEIKEKKTGKARRIALNKTCIKAIQNLLASKQYQNNDYFFQSQRRDVLTVPFNSKSRILQLSVTTQFSEKYHSKSY
jgi:integrase